jgi:hypothetical protein
MLPEKTDFSLKKSIMDDVIDYSPRASRNGYYST